MGRKNLDKQTFSICLDRELVERANEIMERQGRKRSSLLNALLKQWVAKQKEGI